MKSFKEEFNDLIQENRLPILEYPISLDMTAEDEIEWLTVEINVADEGVKFSFDDHNLPIAFDGDIRTTNDNCHLVPFDSEFPQTLDELLQRVDENVREGFILSNGVDTQQ